MLVEATFGIGTKITWAFLSSNALRQAYRMLKAMGIKSNGSVSILLSLFLFSPCERSSPNIHSESCVSQKFDEFKFGQANVAQGFLMFLMKP